MKALLPMAISCLFPTSRDHKRFLSKATLLHCAGRGQCPPLWRGGLPGNRDGTADTLERPGGQWGTLPGSSGPQPLHQQTLQAPPHPLIFVAICVPDGASTQPLNTSRLSPIQHPTPGTKAQKIPALADVDQPEWSKISSSPACSQGFNSSVRTSVRNCSRSVASPCHVNIQLLLANNSTSVTACGETLQIPTQVLWKSISRCQRWPGIARVRAEPRAASPEETSPPPAQPTRGGGSSAMRR